MAEFSIDQENLPGVKEVCRDFAVLEDHCLAHNLQEQEIESHLASNVHKSRLVQQDLQVAKRLQEEEDLRAKAQSKKQYRDIERQDIEIAQEYQEELVRQAERQRLQEEKDAAIARKLQEKEMKEERKRQKQLEANFEEEYYEDQGAHRGPLDLDKPKRLHSASGSGSHSPRPYSGPNSPGTPRQRSPGHSTSEPKRSTYPRHDPAAPQSHFRYPEHHLVAEGGHSRHTEQYPEHLQSSKGKHGDRYPDYPSAEAGRRGQRGEERPGPDGERMVRKKEKPSRPPPPQNLVERDKGRDRERDFDRDKNRPRDSERAPYGDRESHRDERDERDADRDRRKDREHEARRDKEREKAGHKRETSRDAELSAERDRRGTGNEDKLRGRTKSRERNVDEEPVRSLSKDKGIWVEHNDDDGGDGEVETKARVRQNVHSGPGQVFLEPRSDAGRGEWREHRDLRQEEEPARGRSNSHPPREPGRIVRSGTGGLVGGPPEYGLSEATQGLSRLELRELREQELKDMEVARKLQEEELKASKLDKRAAQVAQDEEIARLLMEQEKKGYKKNKEKEKEKERLAMERRRPEGDYKPSSEEVVRPRTREEYEYQKQKNHSKPNRPPQPRSHDYENVQSNYGYSDNPFTPRAPARPEAAYKGAYYRQ